MHLYQFGVDPSPMEVSVINLAQPKGCSGLPDIFFAFSTLDSHNIVYTVGKAVMYGILSC